MIGFRVLVLQYNEQKLRRDYGITAPASPYWDTHMLYLMLGKIAHAFATAELGRGKFVPALPEMILTGKPDKFNHIGGDPEPDPPLPRYINLDLAIRGRTGRTTL